MSRWPAPARNAALHGVAGEFVSRTAPHTESELSSHRRGIEESTRRENYVPVPANRVEGVPSEINTAAWNCDP